MLVVSGSEVTVIVSSLVVSTLRKLREWPVGVADSRAVTGTISVMPMREGCKYYESRTYASGDSVRKCDLDLAPEAPWRCPDDCPKYTPRIADVNWAHGSLISPPTPPEPTGVGSDPSIASLLDEAEDIINAAGRSMISLETGKGPDQAPKGLFGRVKRLIRGRSTD